MTRLYEGGNLEDAKPFKFSSIGRLIDLFGQVCDGVLAAHAAGVIHRDLKPGNIFLSGSPEGDAVVGDFGLCLTEGADRITATSEAVGPRLFMAPELESGRYDDANKLCDVYSLGKLLYWLLSSGEAFSRERHRDRDYDLCVISKNPFLEHVNRLLDSMIVEDPTKRLPLEEIRRRLPTTKTLVERRYYPVGGDVVRPCTYCGLGNYVLRGSDSNSVADLTMRGPVDDVWRVLLCDYCGHVQTFRIDKSEYEPWR